MGQGHSETAERQGHSETVVGQGHSETANGQGHSETVVGQGHSETADGQGPSETDVEQGPSETAVGQGPSETADKQGEGYERFSCEKGGGQVIRMGALLAFVLKKIIVFYDIRVNKGPGVKPGIQEQHLKAIEITQNIGNSSVIIDSESLGATEYMINGRNAKFGMPKPIKHFDGSDIIGYEHTIDIKGAGAIFLALQPVIPFCIFAKFPTLIICKGGTHGTMAPIYDYYEKIFIPMIFKYFSIKIEIKLVKYGFFPRGGGEIHIIIHPLLNPLEPVTIVEPGIIQTVDIHLNASRGNKDLPDMIRTCEKESFGFPKRIIPEERKDKSGNNYIFIEVSTETCKYGFTKIISPKTELIPAIEEFLCDVKQDLGEIIKSCSCFDEHLQDQLLMFALLASGVSKFSIAKVEEHTTAMMDIATLMGAKMDIIEEGRQTIVVIEGIGYNPINLY